MVLPGGLRGRSPVCAVAIGPPCAPAAYRCRRRGIIAEMPFLSGLCVEF